jgi:hypothetical protein
VVLEMVAEHHDRVVGERTANKRLFHDGFQG